ERHPLRRASRAASVGVGAWRAARGEERVTHARRPASRVAWVFLAIALASTTPAFAREMRWKAFDVKAQLGADGRLHVLETQHIVFDGDWNGGERTFRVFPGQSLTLE